MSTPGSSSEEEVSEDLCYLCKTEFTMTNRRHHCRVCGHAVCGYCSPSTVASSAGRVRACERCVERHRNFKTSEISEEVEAQIRIVESLRAALKEKFEEVESCKKFLVHNILGELAKTEIADAVAADLDRVNFFELCDACETSTNRVVAQTKALAVECATERLERLEKERGVELLGERANRAEASLEGVRDLEKRRGEVRSKLEAQKFVLDSLRDRISFLERPRNQRSLEAPSSPLLGMAPRTSGAIFCRRLRNCLYAVD
jgi:FYVE zinc finger